MKPLNSNKQTVANQNHQQFSLELTPLPAMSYHEWTPYSDCKQNDITVPPGINSVTDSTAPSATAAAGVPSGEYDYHSAPISLLTTTHNNTVHSSVNLEGAEKLIRDFAQQLADHKKKQHHLIQSFTESNYKFGEVTQWFMSQISPCLQSSCEQYKQQNQYLHEEIARLRAELHSVQQRVEQQQHRKQELAHSIMQFCERDLTPTQFELFIGALFAALGYSIEHNGRTHDGGIDLIVRHFQKGKGIVQVKQYRKNSKVSEPQIRDLYGAFAAKNEVEYCIMVVLSDCTKEAKTWPHRENVTDLSIWTHKELTNLLQDKGEQCLIEFIKLLNQKHEVDTKQILKDIQNECDTPYFTPKHVQTHPLQQHHSQHASLHRHAHAERHGHHDRSKSTNRQKQKTTHRTAPNSTLSSAKKRTLSFRPESSKSNIGQKEKEGAVSFRMEQMRENWKHFKFSNSGQEEEQNAKHVQEENDGNEQQQENVVQANEAETFSPHSPFSKDASSTHSSLLLDELQDSEDEDDEDEQRENLMSSSYGSHMHSNSKNESDLNNFLWSIQNVNQKRRPRRKWLPKDDQLLLAKITSFGTSWKETAEQWERIENECQFSQNFSLKDIRKHWKRVLKQKLISNMQ